MALVGIESIGIKLSSRFIPAKVIARLQDVPEDKITIGLGCQTIGLCGDSENVVSLSVEAAKRALARWEGDKSNIGLVVVGTESSLDESRPLSAWVADQLGLKGAVRSYEVKHACYGGTVALRQAVEWIASGASQGKVALVIAADVCSYAPGHPAEPTQGAGAIAMIIGRDLLAHIDLISYPYSEPTFDFWRPTGHDFPTVDGPVSLDAYGRAVEEVYRAYFKDHPDKSLKQFQALSFHTPFPKMVTKAFHRLCDTLGIPQEHVPELLETRVLPYLVWNSQIGNSYTASVWISVAQALHTLKNGDKLAAFSYGSGFGAELLTLTNRSHTSPWAQDVLRDFESRQEITQDQYVAWQKRTPRRRGQENRT